MTEQKTGTGVASGAVTSINLKAGTDLTNISSLNELVSNSFIVPPTREEMESVTPSIKTSNRLPQLHATVTTEIFQLVQDLATKEKRTLSAMASILIERGLKDKTRKR